MYKLNEDLATLTTIPVKQLDKLAERGTLCIANAVLESQLAHEQLTEINMGIGTLKIKQEGAELRYVFIPSKELEGQLKEALTSQKSPLVDVVETVLVDRIVNTYKDLI